MGRATGCTTRQVSTFQLRQNHEPMHYPTTVLLASLALSPIASRAQGCSDAGACTAGPIGQLQLWTDSVPDQAVYRHNARLGFSYAIGEQGTIITQVNPEINIGFAKNWSLQLKTSYIDAHGELGENSGVGDLFATTSHAFINETHRSLSGAIGVRLPTGSTTASVPGTTMEMNDRPLPMPYQTGLGTTDLILGINWRHKRYVAAVAYQHVLSQNNENQFTHSAWFRDPAVAGYFESRGLRRADDLVVRAQYAYGCGRLSLQPGLLAIYHVADDTRLNDAVRTSIEPERITLVGSQGLTLNLTVDLRFKLAEQWALEASFGAPVIAREVRPDGLTRENVSAVGLQYRF